jgi:cytochrome c peroxidase
MNRYMTIRPSRAIATTLALLVLAACGGDHAGPVETPKGPPVVGTAIGDQAATVGTPLAFDATLHGTAFLDTKRGGLTYTATFTPSANGLTVNTAGIITGTPAAPAVTRVKLVASDTRGDTVSQGFSIVAFAAGLTFPSLPTALYPYSDASAPLPAHYVNDNSFALPPVGLDNTPVDNQTTDAGATLGRVLFYDPRLSVNDRVSCASCHKQQFGFADTARFSRGFAGALTKRHTMGLANARFYQLASFFWDQRAPTLEDQILQPIQDAGEMGSTLDNVVTKLGVAGYYRPLFQAAFGSPEITSDRVSRSIAQFVRSMVSTQSRLDSVFDANGTPDFTKLTAQEQLGHDVFVNKGNCAACHVSNAVVSDAPHNIGLDPTITDEGAGGGRIKAPSLRNVAIRPPYMRDGRFQTLEQVVEFYDSGVQNVPGLDARLRTSSGPKRLNLTQEERDALVAYMKTFTDNGFLTAPKLANPFPKP